MGDCLSKRFYVTTCFEVEATEVTNDKHCLIISGISEYADSHKNHHGRIMLLLS
jgi:hypothetical protein